MSVKKTQLERLKTKLALTNQLAMAEISNLPRMGVEMCNCEQRDPDKVIAILSDNALGSTVVVYCIVCGGLVGA